MQTGRTDKCGEMEQQEKAKFPKIKIRKIPVFQIRDIQRKAKERATPTKGKTEKLKTLKETMKNNKNGGRREGLVWWANKSAFIR
ncbi:hypothetical protein RUM44_002860 [Polyplax serrata]|uniref:Uncharacterized protein n=1 Tax=Polyplax serrata TaxID=468196 RepID=A0ABR1AWX0_POLSC